MHLKDYIQEKFGGNIAAFIRDAASRGVEFPHPTIHKYVTGQRKPRGESDWKKLRTATNGQVTANDFYGIGEHQESGAPQQS